MEFLMAFVLLRFHAINIRKIYVYLVNSAVGFSEGFV